MNPRFKTILRRCQEKRFLVEIDRCPQITDKRWIGRLARLTKKTVMIRGLNPNAEWIKESKFNLSEITRIEFGGGYEAALALSANTLRSNLP